MSRVANPVIIKGMCEPCRQTGEEGKESRRRHFSGCPTTSSDLTLLDVVAALSLPGILVDKGLSDVSAVNVAYNVAWAFLDRRMNELPPNEVK